MVSKYLSGSGDYVRDFDADLLATSITSTLSESEFRDNHEVLPGRQWVLLFPHEFSEDRSLTSF